MRFGEPIGFAEPLFWPVQNPFFMVLRTTSWYSEGTQSRFQEPFRTKPLPTVPLKWSPINGCRGFLVTHFSLPRHLCSYHILPRYAYSDKKRTPGLDVDVFV